MMILVNLVHQGLRVFSEPLMYLKIRMGGQCRLRPSKRSEQEVLSFFKWGPEGLSLFKITQKTPEIRGFSAQNLHFFKGARSEVVGGHLGHWKANWPSLSGLSWRWLQRKKQDYVGKIPSIQSGPFLQILTKAMIGCFAVWKFFPHDPVFSCPQTAQ